MIDSLRLRDARLAERVAVNGQTGCWEFAGYRSPKGYGILGRSGRMYRAHRYVYELLVGPIPDELVLDHLCRVRHCVNPAHLEPVTNVENLRRGSPGSPFSGPREHCKRGHEFTEENTRIEIYGGVSHRKCVTCKRARDARRIR